jgi:hypothetical protein
MYEAAKGAVILFDGKSLSNWRRRDGAPATWKVEDEKTMPLRRQAQGRRDCRA